VRVKPVWYDDVDVLVSWNEPAMPVCAKQRSALESVRDVLGRKRLQDVDRKIHNVAVRKSPPCMKPIKDIEPRSRSLTSKRASLPS
jgi:hypothetical protein